MSDEKKDSDQPQGQEPPRRRSPSEFKGQLKRIRDEAVGDLKRSLGMPQEGTDPCRPKEAFSSQGRSPARGEEAMPTRASETAKPSAPGKTGIQVTGEPLVQHREKRAGANYAPANDTETLMDAKDAGQYHVAATAGGMSESAHGAMGLDGIRKIYYGLGEQARGGDDPKGEVGKHYPKADPSLVEKDMVGQTREGMRILKEAYKDGYAGKPFKTTSETLQEQPSQAKGTKAKPSGIVGSLWNRIRGSSEPGPASTTVAGVRGSQTETSDAIYARKLLRDGYLRDGDLETVASGLDSTDPQSLDRVRTILAKYRAEGIDLT
jgi:hypothetical protein